MAKLPVDDYVDAPGRGKLVKEVRKKIDELGINYIYYQFISVTGRIVGKGIPADHWERTAEQGFQLVYGSTANLFLDRHGNTSATGRKPPSWSASPIPRPSCQLPWDKRVARVFCTCFRNREEDEEPGRLPDLRLPRQPPQHPRRVPARHQGMHLRHGLRAGDDVAEEGRGRPARPAAASKPYCYHIDQFESLRPVSMRVIEYCRADGPRHDPGRPRGRAGPARAQLHLRRRAAHRDRLTTYRQICAQVAREFDLIACFMSKPFMGVSANGCHHNISLWTRRRGQGQLTLGNKDAARACEGSFTYRHGRREHISCRQQQAPEEAGPGRAALHRRRDRAPAGADRDRLLDRQLLPPAVGHRASGRRSTPTGATRTAPAACAFRRPAGSSTAPSTAW